MVWSRVALVLGLAVMACGLPVAAQPAANAGAAEEIALQRTLDQQITLSLQKVDLSEAFKQIAATAKIPLQVDPACYELLPYGATTQMAVDFQKSKLRDALEEMLVPLGLQQVVSGKVVVIRPSAPLARIGRRAEWEELKLLQELRTGNDLRTGPGGEFNLIDALRSSMEGRKDLVVAATNVNPQAVETIKKQLPMSPYRALELYCQATGRVWFVEAGALAGGPTGGTIHIMTQKEWIERQLERPISLARVNEPLEVIVGDLSHASGIRFVPEPGLYAAVPVVSLSSNNGSVRQTLEALAGATRVGFEVRDDSILLKMMPGPGAAPVAPKADTIVARLAVPVGKDGTVMDVFIRESDLPAELNELRKKKVTEAVDALGKAWAAPPPVPTTAPATQAK